jgi:hypothetical protein
VGNGDVEEMFPASIHGDPRGEFPVAIPSRGHGRATWDLGTPLWTPRRCPHVLDEKPEL